VIGHQDAKSEHQNHVMTVHQAGRDALRSPAEANGTGNDACRNQQIKESRQMTGVPRKGESVTDARINGRYFHTQQEGTESVLRKSWKARKKSRVLAGTGMIAAGAVAVSLGVVLPAAGAPAASARPAAATVTRSTADPNQYPFGAPSGGVAVNTPPPPGEPTLSPEYTTKTTTRIYGADPFQEAVSVTRHIHEQQCTCAENSRFRPGFPRIAQGVR
jgi:hypothetical protein